MDSQQAIPNQQATPKKMGSIELFGSILGNSVKSIGKLGTEALFKDYTLGVQDKTSENLGTQLEQNLNQKPEWQQVLEEMYAREDAIRKETQEREDTAVQRWAADVRAAGLNPNLVNTTGAASGGGITNATGPDYTMEEAKFNKEIEMLMQEIELNFKGDQAEKDRIKDLIKSVITAGAILGGAGMKAAAK